jgi:hypothetical protein
MKTPNLRIIGIEESKHYQCKDPGNTFNKIIQENFSNLKKEMAINLQEAYRTPNRLEQKRNFSCHIIIKTLKTQNKERIIKAIKEKGQVKADLSDIHQTSEAEASGFLSLRPA